MIRFFEYSFFVFGPLLGWLFGFVLGRSIAWLEGVCNVGRC